MAKIENVVNKSCSPNSIFLRKNRVFRKIQIISGFKNWLWKLKMPNLCRLTTMSVYKISKFPFGMLIFMQQYTRKSGLIHENQPNLPPRLSSVETLHYLDPILWFHLPTRKKKVDFHQVPMHTPPFRELAKISLISDLSSISMKKRTSLKVKT